MKKRKKAGKTKVKKQNKTADDLFTLSSDILDDRQELLFIKNILYGTKYAIRIGQHYFVGIQDDDLRHYLGLSDGGEIVSVNIPFDRTPQETEALIKQAPEELKQRLEQEDEENKEASSCYLDFVNKRRADRGVLIDFDIEDYVKNYLTEDYQPVIFKTYLEFEQNILWYSHNVADIIDIFEHNIWESLAGTKNGWQQFSATVEKMTTRDRWEARTRTISFEKNKIVELAMAEQKSDRIHKELETGNSHSELLKNKIEAIIKAKKSKKV